MRLLFLLTILAAGSAHAQPDIGQVQGTINHGQSITILGSGFGVKNPAAPVVWSGFEEGSESVGSEVPEGGGTPYGWVHGTSAPIYTDTWFHSGSTSVGNEVQYGNPGFAAVYKSTTPSSGVEEMYMTMWTYNTAGPLSRGDGKGARMGSSAAAGGTGPYSGIGTHNFNAAQILHGEGGTGLAPAHPSGPTIDVWGVPQAVGTRPFYITSTQTTYLDYSATTVMFNEPQREEYYVKLSTPGQTDGIYYARRISASGTSTINLDIMNRAAIDNYKLNTWLVSNGCANPEGSGDYLAMPRDEQLALGYPSAYFMDDVYLDITRARVELGNAQAFNNCTMREIQIPSSWSDNTIDIAVNTTAFIPDQQAFLFVIDAQGTPSTGFPVTIGESSSEDLGIPGRPSKPILDSNR